MYFRIGICLAVLVVTACTSAKMASDPGLEADSERYLISERPTAFSGDNMVFGHYRASRINRSFITESSESTLGFTSKKRKQDYSYQFQGQGKWKGNCVVDSGSLEYKIVSGGYFADIHCRFVPVGNSAAAWNFDISGETSGTARGAFSIGSRRFEVAAINKVEGSSLRLSQHTGYYFYSDDSIVAGVDTISREGPVWLNRQLSEDEKDAIGLVVVALLLNSA